MTIAEPFFREVGDGPGVVCLHANASTLGQWRGLMDLLAPRFRVFAPDSYDSGKSPHWPSDRVIHGPDPNAVPLGTPYRELFGVRVDLRPGPEVRRRLVA